MRAPARETAAGEAPAGPRVVVGLGNPGEPYEETRHNLGFRVVAELGRRLGVRFEEECASRVARHQGRLPVPADEPDGERSPPDRDPEVWLVAPQTYMNRSGHALHCLAERHGLAAEAFLVVYDDLTLPLGRLRLRPAGSPAGHRGLESVLDSLRTDRVPRLRLGIAGEAGAPPGDDKVDFVLAPFEPEEHDAVETMVARAADAAVAWIAEGAETAMNRFNG